MHKLPRRRFILLAAAGTAGSAALLAACGTGATPPASTGTAPAGVPTAAKPAGAGSTPAAAAASPATGAPSAANLAPGQQLVEAISNMRTSMDPHADTFFTNRRHDMYEMLVSLDPNAEVGPMLATSWQRLDPTTYQFKLRPGLTFHNGSPLTADDVKFSVDRVTRTDKPLAMRANVPTLKEAQVVDPLTVNVSSSAPDPLFLKRMAQIAVLPRAYYEGLGSDDDARDRGFAAAPVGSGPYRFASFTPRDRLVLKAYTTHTWRKPVLTDVTVRQVTDPAAQQAAFQSGEVQYANLLPLPTAQQLQAGGAKLLVATKGLSLGAFMDPVGPDGKPKQGPMGDVRVRRAINLAVDKEKLVKELMGGLTVPEAGQIPSGGVFGANPNLKPFPYDKAQAEQLLDEAGFRRESDGTRFKVTMASAFAGAGSLRRDMGEYVVDQLQQVGIAVEYTPLTDVALAQDYFFNRRPRPDIYHFSLAIRPELDAELAYRWFVSTDPTKHYNNSNFDQTFLAARQELDAAKRADLLQELGTMINQDVPYLFLTEDLWIDATSTKLEGAVPNPSECEQWLDRLYFVR